MLRISNKGSHGAGNSAPSRTIGSWFYAVPTPSGDCWRTRRSLLIVLPFHPDRCLLMVPSRSLLMLPPRRVFRRLPNQDSPKSDRSCRHQGWPSKPDTFYENIAPTFVASSAHAIRRNHLNVPSGTLPRSHSPIETSGCQLGTSVVNIFRCVHA